MNCLDFKKDIILFKEISEKQKTTLKLHIENCANCSKLFNEAIQMETVVERISSSIVIPTNSAKLTSRIMGRIYSSPSLSWSDRIMSILQNSFTKVTLGGVSTILLVSFSLEFFNDTSQTKRENLITSSFAILNSKLFKEETVRQRSKTKFFAECTSPFKPQQYLIDCVKSKLK